MKHNTAFGLKYFAIILIELISLGYTETLETIEQMIQQQKVIDYLSKRYPDLMSDKDLAGKDSVEAFFSNYAGCFDGIENRKYGLKEKDGLLLLLDIIIDNCL